VVDDPGVRNWEKDVEGGADADELANQYQLLILTGLPVAPNLDQTMREAHRRVHLRGLDPLRQTA
jgi:hypothetical protein